MLRTCKTLWYRRDFNRGRPLACVFVLGLAGCGGSSGTPDLAPEAEFVPAFVPASGRPVADGQAPVEAVASFLNVLEEVTLSGQLQFVVKPETTATTPALSAPLQFLLTSEPDNGEVLLDGVSGDFAYTPDEDFFGTDSFSFYVVVEGTGSQQASVEIVVENVNDPPELMVEFQAVAEQGQEYRIALQGTDRDQDNLVYSASNLPSWMNFNETSGLIFGNPDQIDVGVYRDIRFFATDAAGAVAETGPFALEVLDINDSPTVNADQFPTVLDAGERIVVNLFPDDLTVIS